MSMKTNRRAMRFALESEYNDGTTTPEAATDAILMREITVTPLSGSNIERNFVRPYYGNSPQAPGEKHVEAGFEVELNTSGELGTPPPWGKLLRACGWSEVIEVGERVIYSPLTRSILSRLNSWVPLYRLINSRWICQARSSKTKSLAQITLRSPVAHLPASWSLKIRVSLR